MKIGILTFACAYNYGAMLQCYALQETLKEMGHNVEVINYRPSYLETKFPYSLKSIKGLLRIVKHTVSLILLNRLHRYYRFANFEKEHYQQSPIVCRTAEEYGSLIAGYDAVVIGSDQVWNNRWNNIDPIWYGWHNEAEGSQTPIFITYAASAGSANFKLEEDALIEKYVRNFKSLLVREECLKEALKTRYNLESKVVLDPTLLANPQTWKAWQEAEPVKGDYVLVYQGRDDDNAIRIAQKIASDNGWKVICTDLYANANKRSIKRVLVSPNEFVGLVNHAKCVVTTSFHGTAFSLICHTPFYYVRLNDGMDERAESILTKVGLANRLIDKEWNDRFETIDFSEANAALNSFRQFDMGLLKESLTN